jgi:hypothetical protein
MNIARTTAEKKFLAGLLESVAPGWRIRVTDDGQLARRDSGIYLLDTHTLWCGMSFMGSAELESVRIDGKATGLEAAAFSSAASRLMGEVQEASAAGRAVDGDTERDMYFSAAAGLVCSLTADFVHDRLGGLHGHWIMVRYDIPGDAGPTRPLFARSQGPLRLLSPEEVRQFAATAMLTDLSNPDSAVRRLIGKRRPALHPAFSGVAPAEWIDWTAAKA